jgi:GLPGLI family protein
MKKILFPLMVFLAGSTVYGQKMVSELTLVYDISIETSGGQASPTMANMFNGASTTVYIKSNSHRTEQVNALGSTTTIYDGKTGAGVVLKEYGNQKLLIRMTRDNWMAANKKYEGATLTPGTGTKTIAGYLCEQATGKLPDGSAFTVYYTKELVAETQNYNLPFSKLNGLVLEYQFEVNKMKVTNTVSKVLLSPIPPARFETPKGGYRELTYEESLKSNK